MIIIGELINASRKAIGEAISNGDADYIKQVAIDQDKAGADFIDVNAGIFVGQEPEYLTWLVETVQSVCDKPCALDSPDPNAIEAALKVHKGIPIINSISLESDRWNRVVPLIEKVPGIKTVALCMSDDGMPTTAEDRLDIASKLIEGLSAKGMAHGDIYVDPLVQPVGTDDTFGIEFLKAVTMIGKKYPNVHLMCGLSNISFGLPGRPYVNRIFMAQAISAGLDGAIINPLDKGMMGAIAAGEALIGRDKMCLKYLKAFRAGIVEI